MIVGPKVEFQIWKRRKGFCISYINYSLQLCELGNLYPPLKKTPLHPFTYTHTDSHTHIHARTHKVQKAWIIFICQLPQTVAPRRCSICLIWILAVTLKDQVIQVLLLLWFVILWILSHLLQELESWPQFLDVYQHWWIRIQPLREPSRRPYSSIYRTSTSHYKLDWIHGSYRTSTRRQAEKALHHRSRQGDHLQHAHRKSPPTGFNPTCSCRPNTPSLFSADVPKIVRRNGPSESAKRNTCSTLKSN